jgi:hypothetical protein
MCQHDAREIVAWRGGAVRKILQFDRVEVVDSGYGTDSFPNAPQMDRGKRVSR